MVSVGKSLLKLNAWCVSDRKPLRLKFDFKCQFQKLLQMIARYVIIQLLKLKNIQKSIVSVMKIEVVASGYMIWNDLP